MKSDKKCFECGQTLEQRVSGVVVGDLANEYSNLPKASTKDSWYCKIHGNVDVSEK